MAHVYEVRSPTHRYGTGVLEQYLQRSNCNLSVTVFPAAQLGSEEELLEQLVAGELDLAIAGPSFLAMWHPPLGLFDAAYAFRDMDHMLKVAGGPLMAEHWEHLRLKYGIRVLDTWAYGTRHITSKKPIRHPKDLNGFRLRLPGARIWQASGEAMGASPLPISFGEVYLALQQGIADGQENPIPVIHAMGFHEVQSYLNLTGHNQSSIQVLINERAWNRMQPVQQEELTKAIRQLGNKIYRGTMEEEKQLLERWRNDETLRVIEDVDIDAFRQRTGQFFSEGFIFSPLYQLIAKEIAKETNGREKISFDEESH
jgi:tripartite ATP-independent transporter DctP family solute receptor